MNLLPTDYAPVAEVARECRKHPRTILRWAKEHGIAIHYLGRTPWLRAPEFRDAVWPVPSKEES